MKTLSKILFVIAGLLFIFCMLITSIEISVLDMNLYEREYNKINQAQVIGISRTELSEVTKNLIDYTKGERENLNMQATIKGEKREVFNDKEKSHMVDVKALYLAARDFRNIAVIAVLFLAVAGLILYKKGSLHAALRCYLWVCAAFTAALAVLTLWAAADFYSFWTSFHLLFFSNNLWILDPSTDVLIMMVPEQFFFDLVMKIIILFASVFIASIIISFIAKRVLKKKGNAA